jgi:hypothetical protein
MGASHLCLITSPALSFGSSCDRLRQGSVLMCILLHYSFIILHTPMGQHVCRAAAFWLGARALGPCPCRLLFWPSSALRSRGERPGRSDHHHQQVSMIMPIQCAFGWFGEGYAAACLLGFWPSSALPCFLAEPPRRGRPLIVHSSPRY